jgi:rubrerythrin
MKGETGKEKPGLETQIRNVIFWRCINCGGLNKFEEQPEICELCGEGKTFEKMELKIKTSSTQDTKKRKGKERR